MKPSTLEHLASPILATSAVGRHVRTAEAATGPTRHRRGTRSSCRVSRSVTGASSSWRIGGRKVHAVETVQTVAWSTPRWLVRRPRSRRLVRSRRCWCRCRIHARGLDRVRRCCWTGPRHLSAFERRAIRGRPPRS